MKISRELMKEAHKMAKEIKTEYPEVTYTTQLGICIKFLLEDNNLSNRAMELKEELNISEEEAKVLEKVELAYQEAYAEDRKVTFKIWEGYGKRRAYITCPWRSKYANTKNFYDFKEEYLCDSYVRI